MKDIEKIKENLYQFKVKDMVVEMEYLETKKKLDDCLLSILKQKIK